MTKILLKSILLINIFMSNSVSYIFTPDTKGTVQKITFDSDEISKQTTTKIILTWAGDREVCLDCKMEKDEDRLLCVMYAQLSKKFDKPLSVEEMKANPDADIVGTIMFQTLPLYNFFGIVKKFFYKLKGEVRINDKVDHVGFEL